MSALAPVDAKESILGEHAAGPNGRRRTAIVFAWTSFCILVVLGSFVLYLASSLWATGIFAIVLGCIVAGPAMVFGAVVETTALTFSVAEAVGPVLFVLQWLSIWLWGTLSFVRKGHFPLKAVSLVVLGMGVASFVLFWFVLMVL